MIIPACDDDVIFRADDGRTAIRGIAIGVDPAGVASVLVGDQVHQVRFDRIVATVTCPPAPARR